jgi:hypothetical protein
MTWRVERQEKSLVDTNYIVVYDDYGGIFSIYLVELSKKTNISYPSS